MYALFMSIAAFPIIVATGRYEVAIMLPKTDEEATNLAALSIIIASVISLLSLLFIWLARDIIRNVLGADAVDWWLYIIPLMVLVAAFHNVFWYFSNREQEYQRLAINRVMESVAIGGGSITFGLLGVKNGGLILGSFVGLVLSTFLLGKGIWREKPRWLSAVSRHEIRNQAIMYRDFPRINVFHVAMDNLQVSASNILVGFFFETTTLGFYSLATRVVRAPISLVGSSIGQVFFQEASETYNTKGDLKTLFLKTTTKLFF